MVGAPLINCFTVVRNQVWAPHFWLFTIEFKTCSLTVNRLFQMAADKHSVMLLSKVEHAEECGASGVLLYSDPSEVQDSGSDLTEPYPQSRYLPSWATRRGSLWRYGDPLTPSMPSLGEN